MAGQADHIINTDVQMNSYDENRIYNIDIILPMINIINHQDLNPNIDVFYNYNNQDNNNDNNDNNQDNNNDNNDNNNYFDDNASIISDATTVVSAIDEDYVEQIIAQYQYPENNQQHQQHQYLPGNYNIILNEVAQVTQREIIGRSVINILDDLEDNHWSILERMAFLTALRHFEEQRMIQNINNSRLINEINYYIEQIDEQYLRLTNALNQMY